MIPKEKAKELVDKLKDIKDAYYIDEQAKKRALILCDELLDFEDRIVEQLNRITEDARGQFNCESKYWIEVKNEIEKL
jgi:hypothetical protein